MKSDTFSRPLLVTTAAFALLASSAASAQDGQNCQAQIQELEQRVQQTDLAESEAEQLRQLIQDAQSQEESGDNQACLQTVAQVDAMLPDADDEAAQATADAGTQIVIEQPQPNVRLEQIPPRVFVEQQQPRITIHQPAPQVTITVPPPQVTIEVPPPLVRVEQPAPEVFLEQAEPVVSVDTSEPQIQVEQTESEVSVVSEDQEPEISVTAAEGEPQVDYQSEDPQVAVEQSDPEITIDQSEPVVTMERTPVDGVSETEQTAQADQAQPAEGGEQSSEMVVTAEAEASDEAAGDAKDMLEAAAIADIEGLDVFNPEMEDIGTVEYVAIDGQNALFVIMSLDDGVFGIGDSERAVEMADFDYAVEEQALVLIGASYDSLEAMPEWDNDTPGYTILETDIDWSAYD